MCWSNKDNIAVRHVETGLHTDNRWNPHTFVLSETGETGETGVETSPDIYSYTFFLSFLSFLFFHHR